ncbi:hypothetical protein CEXT_319471 [Caerostris extrusa]|uniref:Transmembrane protein n=1 Tax=Caerostris extrusa TaxID=172846 RepID=A0AAV4X021_CAEEX|nr:hypothetical protein CEXT_319471 [Caerostris extrusa]
MACPNTTYTSSLKNLRRSRKLFASPITRPVTPRLAAAPRPLCVRPTFVDYGFFFLFFLLFFFFFREQTGQKPRPTSRRMGKALRGRRRSSAIMVAVFRQFLDKKRRKPSPPFLTWSVVQILLFSLHARTVGQ